MAVNVLQVQQTSSFISVTPLTLPVVIAEAEPLTKACNTCDDLLHLAERQVKPSVGCSQ